MKQIITYFSFFLIVALVITGITSITTTYIYNKKINMKTNNFYETPKKINDYTTYRNYDNRACEVVNDFLDSNLYPYITTTFDRVNELDQQVRGVDCTFSINDYEYICDEKSAIKWANRTLNTFAVELEFINRAGHLHSGWFLSDNQINNSYNFVYTDSIRNSEGDFDYYHFTVDDIKESTAFILKKDSLKNYLNSIGWNKEKLKEKCKEIRKTDGKCEMNYGEVRFFFSKQLPEKPINILVSRDLLSRLADFTFTYKKGDVLIHDTEKQIFSKTNKNFFHFN